MKKLLLLVMALAMVGCREKPQTPTLKEKAEGGDAEAQRLLGFEYEIGLEGKRDLKEAVKWYRKAAEQGESYTQVDLGLMYYEGRGVKQDFKEAAKWFRKAAKQGNADSQSNLGAMYLTGSGVPQDFELSYIWLSVAATNGAKFALKNRNIVTMNLTKDQLKKAKTIFKRCLKKPARCPENIY